MREIRTLRATWRGLETCCGSEPPGHAGAPALDPTDERGWETERCRMAQATAPILDSTKPEVGPVQQSFHSRRDRMRMHVPRIAAPFIYSPALGLA